ncbi:hypothetical protein CFB82_37415 [Burkholderia sp. HI2714]|nr:hypothetical protein CFB82_37415 [Burkholderia sp. HI2714]
MVRRLRPDPGRFVSCDRQPDRGGDPGDAELSDAGGRIAGRAGRDDRRSRQTGARNGFIATGRRSLHVGGHAAIPLFSNRYRNNAFSRDLINRMRAARVEMSNQGNVASSIDGDSRERESSDDSLIGRATLIPIGAIEPEERWRHMMHSLNACSDGARINRQRKDGALDSRRKMTSGDRSRCSATIDILDQPTSSTLVLSWRDSTGGHYGYQNWQKGFARRPGLCAMSGMPITPGDEIFRPSVRHGRPTNASAMILAIHIACIDFALITT